MGSHVREVPGDVRRMVDAWLAAHGGARRFARGESTDFVAIQRWLYRRDYVLSSAKGAVFLRDRQGQRRQVRWRQVVELVDMLRSAEGLETIVAPVSYVAYRENANCIGSLRRVSN